MKPAHIEVPCACGGWIMPATMDDGDIMAAVQAHNESPRHGMWRLFPAPNLCRIDECMTETPTDRDVCYYHRRSASLELVEYAA